MNDDSQQRTGPRVLSREHALLFVLAIATAFAFYLCYKLASPFLPALAWALALAVVAHPLHERIARRIKSPNIAAGLSVIIIAVMLIVPTVFIVRQMAQTSLQGAEAFLSGLEEANWRARIQSNSRLAQAVSWIEDRVDIKSEIQQFVSSVASRISSYVTGTVRLLTEFFITLFALFFFFRDRRIALNALRSLVPLSDAETDDVFLRVSETIHATIYGTVTVALVQGTLGGLMFWWLGLTTPLLWGIVMALLAIVPVFGAFVVWVPAAIYLALTGSWGKALILISWGTIVVGLIDNLLYPFLVGKKMRLHTLPVFIAVIGGVITFGASGLVLGPVVVSITVALVDVWRRRTKAFAN